MYLSFYQLKHKPFQISTDPNFLWLGEKHGEALATLKYGILDNKGFLLLTGDVGTGKTTLINTLLRTLGKNTLVASIRDPALEPMDFYNYTAHAFGLESNFTSKASFLIEFERFLRDANSANKKVLLIIDEAQRINQELLEEVRLLSNIERDDSKLLNIFFVGQLEFNEILLRPENRAIRQRITVNYNIPALSKQETGRYIKHRLEVAGTEEEIHSFETLQENEKGGYVKHNLELPESQKEIFTIEAIEEIYTFSKGYPRLINIICDRSLLTGFVEESKTITPKHVKECVKELKIPKFTRKKKRILVQDVAEKCEDNAVVPLQKSMSTNHISKEQKNDNNRKTARNMTLAIGVLFLLILCYFTLSKIGIPVFQGHSIMEFAQGFWQQTDIVVETNGSDTGKIIIPSQPQPVQESYKKKPTLETDVANITVPENEIKTPGQISAVKMNGAAVAKTGTPEHANGTKPPRGATRINRNVEVVTENNKLRTPGNTDSAPILNKSSPEENITFNTKQIAVQKIQVKSQMTFEKLVIPFPSNSNFPPVNSLGNLNKLVEFLLTQPTYKVLVTGFTDSQGNEAFNEKLSEFRANTVKSYLVGKGLEASWIITLGSGSQYPIASNDTISGRMANRRVEIEIDR
jgi:general secretion pathway protein A